MSSNFLIPSSIGRYVFEEELGSGAFATVYLAMHSQSGQKFAIKIFPKTNLSNQQDGERFQREINAMAFLDHPNVVSLKDLLSDEYNFYLVMDYCAGTDLNRYIEANGKLSEGVAATVFRQIAHALAYVHSFGVAHRDLKPDNVMVTKFPCVKIADFGLCDYLGEDELMKSFCGSPCYCAPECLGLREQYNGRLADIWSLGVILYNLTTGKTPWTIKNANVMVRQIVKGNFSIPKFVSSECRDLITKMMKINPKDRISLDEILRHPWVMGAELKDINDEILNTTIPEYQPISLEDMSEASAHDSMCSDHGIFNPFQDDDDFENDENQANHDVDSSSNDNNNNDKNKLTASMKARSKIMKIRSASFQDMRMIDQPPTIRPKTKNVTIDKNVPKSITAPTNDSNAALPHVVVINGNGIRKANNTNMIRRKAFSRRMRSARSMNLMGGAQKPRRATDYTDELEPIIEEADNSNLTGDLL